MAPTKDIVLVLTLAASALVLKIWPVLNGPARGPHYLAWHEHGLARQEMGPGWPEARAVPFLGLAGSPSGEPVTARLDSGPPGMAPSPYGPYSTSTARHDLLGPIHHDR
jgi:hypothetical protein